MGKTFSLADHVDEIRLAPHREPRGFIARRLGRITDLADRGSETAGTLRATDSALLLRAEGDFENGIEIPLREVRKLIVDDGTRWGYVSGVCRFPVYDLRPDGTGSGVLIGPLWSHAATLLPDGCPIAEVGPVPNQAPNVAVLLDPPLAANGGRRNGAASEAGVIAAILLRVEDPEAARETLGPRHPLGDIGHDDLEYLAEMARRPAHGGRLSPGHEASAASA